MSGPIRRELTLKLMQKIGDITYELEAQRGDTKVELSARQDDGRVELLENLEIHELNVLSHFLERCRVEVEKLNDTEKR